MGEGFVTADDGARLWWTSQGSGPPVVLTHGGPGLADDLDGLPGLLDHQVTVIRWHQRGVGRSDPVGPHTLARYDADLTSLRQHLGLDRWVVGGHSFGATLALRHALAHPERTIGLLYVAGVGTGRDWHAVAAAEADRRLTPEQRARRDALTTAERTPAEEAEWRILAWLPDHAGRPEQALARATAQAASCTGPICWEANRSLREEVAALDEPEVLAACRGLDRPVLVVHGAADPRPSWAVDAVVEALPDVEVHVIPDAGHRPWVEAPQQVGAVISRWLGERAGARG